ncbi:hypothetical protein AWE62_22685 [Escherichia coli]|nr:hypothetical protein AWE62_22685 [Escherichia coli]
MKSDPLISPQGPNIAPFVTALATARRSKSLNFVDDVTRECLTITIACGISGVQITCILDSIALFQGYPATIRTDQGPEFTCRASQRRTDLLRALTDDFAINV